MAVTLTPTKQIEPKKGMKKEINIAFLQRVSAKEKIFFIQNLKTMIKAGMSLTESLQTLARQTENKKLQKILDDMIHSIEKGETLSKTMSRHSKVFPEIMVNMIAAGEMSGNLEGILEQLFIQMKKDHDLVSKVRGAMTYPAVVLFAMLLMGVGMMIFVFPTFVTIFEEANAELPAITKALIGTSKFMTEHGIISAGGILLIIIAFFQTIKTKSGKKLFHLFLLKMIIIGPIVQKINLARFGRSLSSLLKTDIPIVRSFEITASVVGNVHYQKVLTDSIKKIEKGSAISDTLQEHSKLFPPMMIQMLIVGERSGTTDELLGEIATFYEEEVDNITKNLSTIIEPLLILFIGAAVGLMAVSVMMPMYNLAEQY